jgi:hypothetical protein
MRKPQHPAGGTSFCPTPQSNQATDEIGGAAPFAHLANGACFADVDHGEESEVKTRTLLRTEGCGTRKF